MTAMADSDTHEAEAELRISRVKSLSEHDLMAVVTYLLAKHRGVPINNGHPRPTVALILNQGVREPGKNSPHRPGPTIPDSCP